MRCSCAVNSLLISSFNRIIIIISLLENLDRIGVRCNAIHKTTKMDFRRELQKIKDELFPTVPPYDVSNS